MNRIVLLLLLGLIASCAKSSDNSTEISDQKIIYKNWVLSRCLSYSLKNEEEKKDALNTASSYLEQSNLSVESLLNSEPLIHKFIEKKYQGSISGTFEIKKCIDLYSSSELDELYFSSQK
ncbi:T6SS amidase immunity protein Tai4 family protein [Psychromonas antarctica]|uniref:T6SS amidase immunity protein Tai4 family protein n=1 Tax=Psychromonas antarctica TaxID=67573 RepID=UPI001EE7C346|nr:T6SS amidase immunity protein Tai4 family protein [Psychromonas antarctica]MCG6201200.1 type VI secretion system amidase immunity protein Tai4 [Psychromonas antarctica]